VKKINDVAVFAITTTFSVLAYLWLFLVLQDKQVETWEGVVTFLLFWVLLICAYLADCMRAKKIKESEASKFGDLEHLTVVDFYNKLVPIEKG